jgi:hypothetical protein
MREECCQQHILVNSVTDNPADAVRGANRVQAQGENSKRYTISGRLSLFLFLSLSLCVNNRPSLFFIWFLVAHLPICATVYLYRVRIQVRILGFLWGISCPLPGQRRVRKYTFHFYPWSCLYEACFKKKIYYSMHTHETLMRLVGAGFIKGCRVSAAAGRCQFSLNNDRETVSIPRGQAGVTIASAGDEGGWRGSLKRYPSIDR